MNNQKVLLRIVQTWDINPNPEYRGFRCANCQRPMRKAWYHWLITAGYKRPVHFCKECEKKLRSGKIKIEKPIRKVDKPKFIEFPEDIKSKLQKVVQRWNIRSKPIYKAFTCDNCGKKMSKAYHIWFIFKHNLVEVHFCRQCKEKTEIGSLLF